MKLLLLLVITSCLYANMQDTITEKVEVADNVNNCVRMYNINNDTTKYICEMNGDLVYIIKKDDNVTK